MPEGVRESMPNNMKFWLDLPSKAEIGVSLKNVLELVEDLV